MGALLVLSFYVIVLVFSVVLHELAHGLTANYLGDPTARYAGRLTLNPIKHLDMVGSFLMPVGLLILSGGRFTFGWAKPVPYNPYNLKNQKWGPALVAGAGPLVNFLLAVVFGLALRVLISQGFFMSGIIVALFSMIVFLNLVLGVFNSIPIPPLDGSKILFAVLPYRYDYLREKLEQYGIIILLLFVFFFFSFLTPVIAFLFEIVTSIPFGTFLLLLSS